MTYKLLGADPEFLLMNNGRVRHAYDAVRVRRRRNTETATYICDDVVDVSNAPNTERPTHSQPLQEAVCPEATGCSICDERRSNALEIIPTPAPLCNWRNNLTTPERVEPPTNIASKFGYDGGSIAAEIRPDPCDNPATLVKNIRIALLEGKKRLKNKYEWIAGTGTIGRHPTGGHLHLGVDNYSTTKLDVYIGIPLIALEPPIGRRYRRYNNYCYYGQWGDVRRNDWGVEYRTPSSWLVSPAVTGIAAALAWLVARNFEQLNIPQWHRERFEYSWEEDGDGFEFQKWLTHRSVEVLKRLQNLNDYKKVAGLLDPYKFIANVVGDWQEDRDMLDTWRLRRAINKNLVTTVKEEIAEETALTEKRSSIVWNHNDLHIPAISKYCGNVQSSGHDKLFAVGAKEVRGVNLLLSPALMNHEKVHYLLDKHKLPYCEWPDYPERNGELVIGLPIEYRTDHPDKCGDIIRMIALSVFGRIQ